MATQTSIAVTQGTGKNIDAVTTTTAGNTRQVITVGDPATDAGLAPVSATNGLSVTLTTAIPAGTNLLGKTGIDQTTPGTTNGVQINAALPAGTNSIGTVQIGNTPNTTPLVTTQTPSTVGGLTTYSASVGATATSVKSSGGVLYGWYIYNVNAAVAYVQIFNLATGGITLGSTAPTLSLGIPPGGAANVEFVNGLSFATAISYACTTTRTGASGPVSTLDVNFLYK